MTISSIVTSVSAVPFRRFLPHEKPVSPQNHDFAAHYDIEAQNDETVEFMPQVSLLSSEDMNLLLHAGQEDHEPAHDQSEGMDLVYLPFEFALAARN